MSNFTVDLLERARALGPVDCLQPPYHLYFRNVEEEILPYCIRHGIPTFVYGPLCKGLLTGKFQDCPIPDDIRRKDPFFGAEVLPALLATTAELIAIAEDEGITPAQLALAFTLAQPGIRCAIVGARTPAQIRETARAGSISLSDEVLRRVRVCIEAAPRVV